MACSIFPLSFSIPELPEKAFHPNSSFCFPKRSSSFCFPKRSFGKSANVKMRSCKAEYFHTWPLLTYDVEKDVVFCHLCIKSVQGKKLAIKRSDPSFLQWGFPYWKDAIIEFKKHESSACHKEAVEVSIVLPSACLGVGEMLSSQRSQQKKENTGNAFLRSWQISSSWLGKGYHCVDVGMMQTVTLCNLWKCMPEMTSILQSSWRKRQHVHVS